MKDDGRIWTLGALLTIAAAGIAGRKGSGAISLDEAQALVVRLLQEQVGLEVGDYHHEFFVVQHDKKCWSVKLEGWGYECVGNELEMEGATEEELRGEAWRRAAALAVEWKSAGWTQAGVVTVEGDDEVWVVTWALSPFYEKIPVEEEDVVWLD